MLRPKTNAPGSSPGASACQAQRLDEPGEPETRVDLQQPIPVYIVYFTAAPEGSGLSVRPDIYHRDAPLIARLAAGAARA